MNQRAYSPGFAKGLLDSVWFSKTGTEEALLGVKEALNVTLEPDGSLAKRPGSTHWLSPPAPSSGVLPGKMIPYSAGGVDYILYVRVDLTIAANRTIHVYQRNGSTWSTTPVDWSDGGTVVGEDDFTPYIDNTNLADTTLEGHWYNTDEVDQIKWAQYDDKLFIFHPNHPTIMIWKRPDDVWVFDPYALERHPAEVGGQRRGLTWSLTPPSSGHIWTVVTNQKLFDGDMLGSQKDTGAAVAQTVAFDGVTNVTVGSIFRFGSPDVYLTAGGGDVRGFGEWWCVIGVDSPTQAKVTPINPQSAFAGSTFTFQGRKSTNQQEWAGPWNRDEIQTRSSIVLSAAIGSGNPQTVNILTSGVTSTDVGTVLLSPTLQTAFYVIAVDTGAGTMQLLNIGKDAGAVATGILYVYRQPKDTSHVYIDCSQVSNSTMLSVGKTRPPEGHDTAFTDIAWVSDSPGTGDLGSSTRGVGGSMHVGGGVLRVYGNTDYNLTTHRKARVYNTEVQKAPSGCGPFQEFGWGASTAAGFAACGAVHQRRLFTSGYAQPAAAITASLVNDPTKQNALDYTGYADGPINIVAGFDDGDVVRWMLSGDFLMIGTAQGEWIMDGNPISTSSLGLERVGATGSADLDPVMIGPRVLWVAPNKREVKEAVFEERFQGIVTRSLMWQSKEALMTQSDTIVQITATRNNVDRVHCVTASGLVLTLTHDEGRGVIGWTRWVPAGTGTGNTIDNYAQLLPIRGGSTSYEEQVLLAFTQRWSAGVQYVAALEHIKDYYQESQQEYGDLQHACSSLTATSAATAGVSYGITSRQWAMEYSMDGSTYIWGGLFTDTAGTIDYTSLGLSVAPTAVRVSLAYDVNINLPVPPFSNERGATQGQLLNARSASLFLDRATGGSVKGREINPALVSTTPTEFTGWRQVPGALTGAGERFPSIAISQYLPYNFRLSAVAFDSGSET